MKKSKTTARSALFTPKGITGLYGLFMLTGFLLWAPKTGYQRIVDPKHKLFLISFGVFLGLLALAFVFRTVTSKKQRCRFPAAPSPFSALKLPLFLALGLTLWFFLSSLCSSYPEAVWLGSKRNEGFFTLLIYLLIFALCALFWNPGKVHRWGAALSGMLIFFMVLAQFLGFNPLGLYPGELTFHHRGLRYTGEYLGTIGNSGLLGSALTVLCLYLLGSYAVSREKDRFFLLAGGLCAWGGVLLSEVAAGPVAIFACFGLLLPVCVRKGLGLRHMGEIWGGLSLFALGKTVLGYEFDDRQLTLFWQWNTLSWVLLAMAFLSIPLALLLRKLPQDQGYPKAAMALWIFYTLVFLAGFLFLFFYEGDVKLLHDLHLLTRLNPPDTLGSGRIAIWKDALELGLDRPLLGGGPDTYDLRSDFVFTRELPDGNIRRVSVDAAHNEYLQLWVCCGLPAMLLHLSLLGSVILPAVKKLEQKQLPLLLPVVGYSIYAFFGISQSLSAPLLYLILGALAHCQVLEERVL